ncbi:MAG: sensor histidine kinase [Pseudomonadota bacterium]
MQRVLSLRGRLTAIILIPLLLVALLVGLWQLNNARRTATDVFDRSLLAAALAVANDVAVSGGDALSPRTRDILADTSGGQVFYHVYAPDGVIVAGYATPPVGIQQPSDAAARPTYFNATYLGRDVHGVRLQNTATIDDFTGVFTTTVWQDAAVRSAFVGDLLLRSLLAICGLIAALAMIVWFGVRTGLQPLNDLEAAIARRSSDELSPIQRAVPVEVGGVVRTLNRLFDQVSQSMTAQSEFISNAAHQLKNPIAGVLSLAEAVDNAPDYAEAKKRSSDLLEAARETATLSQQLLLLERAKSISPSSAMEPIALDAALADWIGEARHGGPPHVTVDLTIDAPLGTIRGDPTMLREAIRNLISNAFRHGGDGLTHVRVTGSRDGPRILVSVTDDGTGMTNTQVDAARERFRTFAATSGSGLGISIVEAIAHGHGGSLALRPLANGFRADMEIAASERFDTPVHLPSRM